MDALGVLRGHHALFFPANQGREGMVIYATALAIGLLGRTITAVRLPAALASVGTVLAVFWLGQVLFNERRDDGKPPSWRGLFVGGTAAGILAVSLGSTIIGRDSFRANFLPLFLALAIGFLWTGLRQRSLWRLALAGALHRPAGLHLSRRTLHPPAAVGAWAEFPLARFARPLVCAAICRWSDSIWRSPGWSRCRWLWTLLFIPSTSARAPAGCSSLTLWLTRATR